MYDPNNMQQQLIVMKATQELSDNIWSWLKRLGARRRARAARRAIDETPPEVAAPAGRAVGLKLPAAK